MSSCNYNCDNQLGTYEENECQLELPGGSNQIIFLECGHGITDPSSYTQVHNAIIAGKARLVSGVAVDIPAASPNKQTSKVPCRADTLLSYNRTVNYYNPNVSTTNDEFHSQLFGGHNVAGVIIYMCGTDDPYVYFIDSPMLFTGSAVLPATTDEAQYYQGVGEYKSLTPPALYPAPAGIFSS